MPDSLPPDPEIPVFIGKTYRNRGSITIPDAARKAHRIELWVEVLSVSRSQSFNETYNPHQGRYGNVTVFCSGDVVQTIPLQYKYQRIIDFVNVETSAVRATIITEVLIVKAIGFVGNLLGNLFTYPVKEILSWGYPNDVVKVVCYPGTQFNFNLRYYPYNPYDDIPVPDPQLPPKKPKEKEHEPTKKNPSGDPWKDNPDQSTRDPERDIRDYDFPPPGSNCGNGARITVGGVAVGGFGNGAPINATLAPKIANFPGPYELRKIPGTEGTGIAGSFSAYVLVGTGGSIGLPEASWYSIDIENVECL